MPDTRFTTFVLGCLLLTLPAIACSGRLRGGASSTTTGSTLTPASTSQPGSGSGAAPTIKPGVPPDGSTTDHTLKTPDGRTRTYHLFVPGSVGDRPVPLLVALHGGTGSGTQYARNSGYDNLAEANGFVVAYPDGIGVGPRGRLLRTWNGGNCCGPAAKHDVDDVTFIRMVLDDVAKRQHVDPRRVFLTGHSNGGILAYRVACELSDRIAAIGVQSSSLGISPCSPTSPVSVIHIHGTADKNVPIDGGKGADAISGVSFWPPLDGVRTLAAADGCATTPTSTVDPSNPDVTVERWHSCKPGIDVEFVKVAGAPHGWMGHAGGSPIAIPAYQKLDSSAVIWSFLAAHPKR